MRKGILLAALSVLVLQAGIWTPGELFRLGPRNAASSPSFHVKPIHPLPDWNGQENLRPLRTPHQEEGSRERFRISVPVVFLASLVFFLMWKLMQGQV